jgi:hypothetical protein
LSSFGEAGGSASSLCRCLFLAFKFGTAVAKKPVIPTEAADSIIVGCEVEGPPNFAFVFAGSYHREPATHLAKEWSSHMKAQIDRNKSRVWSAILLLSLALNGFLIWNDHYDVPDENFYSHRLRDAYFVKMHPGGEIYLIDHQGHRYTAECQDTLTWLDGIYSSGRPMTTGCTYIPSLVGKSIAEGLMRKEGNTLVYQPWEQADTEQTADLLKIIGDHQIK